MKNTLTRKRIDWSPLKRAGDEMKLSYQDRKELLRLQLLASKYGIRHQLKIATRSHNGQLLTWVDGRRANEQKR